MTSPLGHFFGIPDPLATEGHFLRSAARKARGSMAAEALWIWYRRATAHGPGIEAWLPRQRFAVNSAHERLARAPRLRAMFGPLNPLD